MNVSDFKIDTTLNVEGIIAAVAILGAAIGFIINLIKTWQNNHNENKFRGTNFIILDLLELNFQLGLSEDHLWELYSSTETLEKRKSFNAYSPKKLKRIGFENQLKHLQSSFLIRLTGPAHYHIDFSDPSNWKSIHTKNTYTKIISLIKKELRENELQEILNKTIQTADYSFYRLKDTHKYLIEIGDTEAILKLISDMRSNDLNIRKSAVELFIELNRETL